VTAWRRSDLTCVDDDVQGEVVEVLWDAELDGSVLKDEGWASVAKFGTDEPNVFSAYLRALRWNTATAADRDLFHAPFRAGIHQGAYQLLPLRKAQSEIVQFRYFPSDGPCTVDHPFGAPTGGPFPTLRSLTSKALPGRCWLRAVGACA
jgi:hypothetical protein